MKTRSAPKNQVRGRTRTKTTAQRRATRPRAQRASARGAGGRAASARSTSSRARSATPSRRARTGGGGRGGSAQLTTDHDEIRSWVEERGGHPATVKRSVKSNQPAGILRIDFPGFSGEVTLKPVSWEEWFDIFETNRLGFLHQDRTASGKPSRFNKIVCR